VARGSTSVQLAGGLFDPPASFAEHGGRDD
jgi:hypothetical protein